MANILIVEDGSGRKFNLIVPICQEICYNIGLYQVLFPSTNMVTLGNGKYAFPS